MVLRFFYPHPQPLSLFSDSRRERGVFLHNSLLPLLAGVRVEGEGWGEVIKKFTFHFIIGTGTGSTARPPRSNVTESDVVASTVLVSGS